MSRSTPASLLRPAAILTALLAVAVPALAPASTQLRTVVLKNGNRMMVARAWQDGASYHLALDKGGEITIPAELVKRVSLDAADRPSGDRGLVVASSSTPGGAGGWTPPPQDDPPPYEPPEPSPESMDAVPGVVPAVNGVIRPGMPGVPAPPANAPTGLVGPNAKPRNNFLGKEIQPQPGMLKGIIGRPAMGNTPQLTPAGDRPQGRY